MDSILLSLNRLNQDRQEIWRYAVITHWETEQFTMGFVMNQRVINVQHQQIHTIYGLDHALPRCHIWCGGPLNTEKCTILHSQDYRTPDTQLLGQHSGITFNNQIVRDINQGRGPKHWKVMLGHTAWQPGQLTAELMKPGTWCELDWHDAVWGQYRRKDKMWRRIMDREAQQSASQFLHTVVPS